MRDKGIFLKEPNYPPPENPTKTIDYDKLLDKWFEEVVKKADSVQSIIDIEDYDEYGVLRDTPTRKHSVAKGFIDGLYYATAILSRLEKKEGRIIK